MSTEDDAVELGMLPRGLPWWLEGARWIADEFPSFRRRSARVRAELAAVVSPNHTALAADIARGLEPFVSSNPLAVQIALRDHVVALARAGDRPELSLLEFAVVLLDATSRQVTENPFTYAVDHMGWHRVPEAFTRLAAELGLLSWEWFNGSPQAMERMHACPGLAAFGAAVERLAGALPAQGWRRALRRPTTDARRGTHAVRGSSPLVAMIGRFDATSPDVLVLYERLADIEQGSASEAIERASAWLTRSPDLAAANAGRILRAALRRCSRDPEGAAALAEQVVDELPRSDGTGAVTVAAAIIATAKVAIDPIAANRWYDEVLRRRDVDGNVTFAFGALLEAALVRHHLGDEVGGQRLHAAAAAIAPCDPMTAEYPLTWPPALLSEQELAELREGIRRSRHERHHPPGPLPSPYDDAQLFLARREPAAAYSVFSEYVGHLLEEDDREAARRQLDLHIRWYATHDLLRAWLCAVAAELCSRDEHERWCRYKEQQIETEDTAGITEDEAATVQRAEFFQKIGPLERARICVREAERAFAEGYPERARFWIARAEQSRREA